MKDKLREAIDNFANGIWDVFNLESNDIDLESFVKNIGGTIETRDELPNGADGMLRKTSNDVTDHNFEISVNKELSSQRIKFTIAHELGHLFLHCGYIVNKEKWDAVDLTYYKNEQSDENELEANEFARDFLMPEDRFREFIMDHSHDNRIDMNLVANNFNVSLGAAINRARQLGIIE